MNIKKVRKPAYAASCAKCHGVSPLAFTYDEAERIAREKNWRIVSTGEGHWTIGDTLCPKCYAERQANETRMSEYKFFNVGCAGCPNVGPPATTAEEAEQLALKEGWHIRHINKQRDILCRECWFEWLAKVTLAE